MSVDPKTCRHLDWKIYPTSPAMCAHCRDCEENIPLRVALNNWKEHVDQMIQLVRIEAGIDPDPRPPRFR